MTDRTSSDKPPTSPVQSARPVDEIGHAADEPSRHSPHDKGLFRRIRLFAELLSFIAVAVAAPVALLEWKDENAREQIAVAETTYRDVDAKYADFLKLCIEHPRLDCYSVPAAEPDPPLSQDEKNQQKILYSALTDVFEVAFVEYRSNQHDINPVVKEIFSEQWKGWDDYIRKFLRRPAYCHVYLDIRDEYDTRLVAYMDAIAHKCQAAGSSAK